MGNLEMTRLLGVCNPLLDITCNVDAEFLNKWNLKANDAILAGPEHAPLYKEMESTYKCHYSAGGAGLNSIRVAQWFLQEENATCFFGATSKDRYEEILKTEANKIGMQTEFYDESELPTGTCATLLTGHNRSMVANLSAANTFNVSHLDKPSVWKHVQETDVVYVTGFFHTVSVDTILKIGEYAAANKKTFTMNLSAPFLLQVPPFFESFKKVQPLVDVYFGNESEYAALAAAYGWEYTDLSEVLEKLCALRGDKSRLCVMTQGADPTVIVEKKECGQVVKSEHPVKKIDPSEIVDTSGAGDAFVGGFLAGLVKHVSIEKCVEAGNYCANEVIKRDGCDYPEKPIFSL
eukprot:GDKJ01020162.1.p1 GENE.GDKJ01020162.1~~GDKJ01020162.1.p1  ORF type:complete len:349 (-),score=112.52 GDKJ01020162.1:104-1150(-)